MPEFLNYLETNIPENAYVSGESLYDKITDFQFEKLTRGIHKINFSKGKKSWEVEIKFLSKTESQNKCSCGTKGKKAYCEHIVASLFYLRKHLDELEKQKKKKSAVKRPRASSEFVKILDVLPADDIKSFIKGYAKKNQSFKLEFEAHFASKVDFEDNESKYKNVLDKLVKPKSNHHLKLTNSSLSTFRKVLQDYWAQSNDMFSLDRFDEVYYASRYCLEKLYYAKYIYEIEQDFVLEYIRNFCTLLHDLLEKDLAPEFRDQIAKDLKDFVQFSFCFPNFGPNIYDLVFEQLQLSKAEIFEILNQLTDKMVRFESYKSNKYLSRVITSKADNQVKFEWLNSNYPLPIVLNAIGSLHQSVIDNYYDLLIMYEEKFPEVVEISYYKIRDLLRNDKFDQAITDFMTLLEESKNIDRVIPFLSLIPPQKIEKKLAKIRKKIARYPDKVKTSVFAQLQSWKDVSSIIVKSNDMQLMTEYGSKLYDLYPDVFEQFFIDWTQDYYQNHIGSKSRETLIKVHSYLKNVGGKQISQKIKDNLKNKFQHRKNVNVEK